jgi:hypothetical protein
MHGSDSTVGARLHGMAKDKRLDPEQVQRDLERFAAALKDSEKADKAAKEKERKARDERDQAVAAATAKANETTDAKRELERAVEGVRRAKASGRGRAEADAAWKVAKIELGDRHGRQVPKPEPWLRAWRGVDFEATARPRRQRADGDPPPTDETVDTDAGGYQPIGWRSPHMPPVGPSSGSSASHTGVSAPSSIERSASAPPMRVRTQPGQQALTSTPLPARSFASCTVSMLSAAFDTP